MTKSRSQIISRLGSGGYRKSSEFVKMVPLCKRFPFSVDKRYTRTNGKGGKNKTLSGGDIKEKDGLVPSFLLLIKKQHLFFLRKVSK